VEDAGLIDAAGAGDAGLGMLVDELGDACGDGVVDFQGFTFRKATGPSLPFSKATLNLFFGNPC
jgi:hypothetical protein